MPSALDFYSQTRVFLPKKIGNATIENALEVADAVGCIEIVIRHIAQNERLTLNKTCEDTIKSFAIDKLSLARASKILIAWKKWTWSYSSNMGQLPKLSDCTQFLYEIKQ